MDVGVWEIPKSLISEKLVIRGCFDKYLEMNKRKEIFSKQEVLDFIIKELQKIEKDLTIFSSFEANYSSVLSDLKAESVLKIVGGSKYQRINKVKIAENLIENHFRLSNQSKIKRQEIINEVNKQSGKLLFDESVYATAFKSLVREGRIVTSNHGYYSL